MAKPTPAGALAGAALSAGETLAASIATPMYRSKYERRGQIMVQTEKEFTPSAAGLIALTVAGGAVFLGAQSVLSRREKLPPTQAERAQTSNRATITDNIGPTLGEVAIGILRTGLIGRLALG